MGNRYVEPRGARHRIELIDGVQQLRIPMRRQWFTILFLSVWLCGWTAGGITAMTQVVRTWDWFLIFWLGGWAIGWVFAAGTVAGQLAGAEILRVVNGDLEVSNGIGQIRRTRLYRGGTIRNLTGYDPVDAFPWRGNVQTPFMRSRTGAVKFDYGAETIFLAASVQEPEGNDIARWLGTRLPKTATLTA